MARFCAGNNRNNYNYNDHMPMKKERELFYLFIALLIVASIVAWGYYINTKGKEVKKTEWAKPDEYERHTLKIDSNGKPY